MYGCMAGRTTRPKPSSSTNFLRPGAPSNAPVADQGQIQLDCFGRINGAGWHWAGEADVFEAIAAVKKRYKIDDKRVILRGFSQGGEGAWHISLHHPDRVRGRGNRRGHGLAQPRNSAAASAALSTGHPQRSGRTSPSGRSTSITFRSPGTTAKTIPGQLESSLRARAQLEKEGFPSEGDKDYLHSVGAPGLWMVSLNTGHGTSPLVRQRLDAFLKEWGDKGQTSPDHLRFVTYTTRYNRDYWVSLDGLEQAL